MIKPELLASMCNARRQLRDELETTLKVSRLAGQVGLTTEHFIVLFRALFGQTPLQCRRQARVEQARNALANSRESAIQIALALGFDAPGSFSRAFRRDVGVSPRAFRAAATTFVEPPPGCVTLLNTALADLDFGKVGGWRTGHDSTSTTPESPHAHQPHQHICQ